MNPDDERTLESEYDRLLEENKRLTRLLAESNMKLSEEKTKHRNLSEAMISVCYGG